MKMWTIQAIKASALPLLGMSVVTTTLAAAPDVPYPKGYRDWHHVKSMVIEEGHPLFASFGGIHHIYANDKAMKGYRSGAFPDGAVIIFDLLEAVRADHAITEGQRKVLGVMHKDAKKYASTGGWGFEGFGGGDPANRVVGDSAASACFACHQPQQAQDYTFSRLRD
ncbi:cytochrome P460 family protein [Methylococcus geothermalis]|uniref:Cytochrome C n=1 Tax=Methylococcus geothermalis TaxID=2681310 RepID=A0A858Q4L4_9GAMM|nr:cytochrome P460 family protein [Methylococcus geothermalis]QJD28782.1 cytochrome C [Methylococcus geothermalis]